MRCTGNPELMKRLNQSAILRTIREQGRISRADIAKTLRLNPSTVTRIVNGLIEEDLVFEEEGRGESTARGGRRPVLLEFNYKSSLIIGVDLGGSDIVGALSDLDGNILHHESICSRFAQEGLETLMALVQGLVDIPRLPGQEIRAIGIGAPGVTLSREGIVTWAPALGWRDVPLKQLVEERFGVPTFVENDVNLHALGEHWRGVGQGVKNLVCIFIGTGIGAGIIINGDLYRGANYAAGEVGYIIPSEKYLGQCCEGFGCLEYLAAGFGIAQRTCQAIREGNGEAILKQAGDDIEGVNAEHVFIAAREGDALACRIVADVVKYLAIAVANVISILDPQMIILGGGIAKSDDLILEPIKELVRDAVPVMPEIVVSQLGSDAGVLGAVTLAMRSTEDLIWELQDD